MRAGRRAGAGLVSAATLAGAAGLAGAVGVALGLTGAAGVVLPAGLSAQQVQRLPLAPIPPKGEPVAPFYEGWYRNDDGTFALSFGFFNLNGNQALDLPLGSDNFIEPSEFDGAQPTHFPARPRRDRGVFHVTVPAEYGDGERAVVWSLTANGVTYATPGRVGEVALQLDYGPRAMGSIPPMARFGEDAPEGQHVQGVWSEPLSVAAGEPLELRVWTREVSERDPNDAVNQSVDVAVTWFKHQGPAAVTFDPVRIVVEGGTGEAATSVVFGAPGEYVLRARVDNWSANDSTGGDQCCWTNAYARVAVTP